MAKVFRMDAGNDGAELIEVCVSRETCSNSCTTRIQHFQLGT